MKVTDPDTGSIAYVPSSGTVRVLLSAEMVEPLGWLTKITEVGSIVPSTSLSLARIFIVIGISSFVSSLSSVATGGSLTSLTAILETASGEISPSLSVTVKVNVRSPLVGFCDRFS